VFLPVHAAGIYNPGNLECCSDYVVSSYTPTLSALYRARANLTPISHKSLVLLAAGASETLTSLNMPFLANVQAEIADVTRIARATYQIEVVEYGHTSPTRFRRWQTPCLGRTLYIWRVMVCKFRKTLSIADSV
jgi:hypothetical protein